jgi:hypothetical protein
MRAPDYTILPVTAIAVSIALSLAVCAPGCSPGASGSHPPESDPAGTLELECERGLEALDDAIQRSEKDALVSAAALHEARALRSTAGELYLEAEFQLALELIDEALALLGGT